MNKAKIIEAIYKDAAYRNVCRNIASPALFEDLFHEVIINLLDMPDEKILEAKEKKYLKFLFVKIAHNSWNSKHSPFYRKYRHNDINETIDYVNGIGYNWIHCEVRGYKTRINLFNPLTIEGELDPNLQAKEDVFQTFTQEVKDKIDSLDWYDQTLLKLYIDIGEFRKISVMTGIKYGAVQYTIQKTIKKLKLENYDGFKNFSDSYNS
jgi:DNA-directed RNA polymerase specialized sigma24 family protein